jgi:hypothetical protein
VNLALRYQGRSELRESAAGVAMRFAPNLARPKVFLDAGLRRPELYREAMSALHEVVVSHFGPRERDREAYLAWKKQEAAELAAFRAQAAKRGEQAALLRAPGRPLPPDLEKNFRAAHQVYWGARRQWASELQREDPELFRHLVPCDPIVTVAPDVILFEGFAKDESSYGCLSVDRELFEGTQEAALGTTNVDYSLALYDHIQTLRSYRSTRLLLDPAGFGLRTDETSGVREEKIDVPPSWLRGFGQVQAAMALPHRHLSLPVETVYSLLAWLRRHRERRGPRSLRFELVPGQQPTIVIEPWTQVITVRGPVWQGERSESIKVWGRRRLGVLARLLPVAERFDVILLGSGLPSVWIARMGGMRFALALSGWTANDWSQGSPLQLLAGFFDEDVAAIDRVAAALRTRQRATTAELEQDTGLGVATGPALFGLASRGHCIYDYADGVHRYREAMPFPLDGTTLGPAEPELLAARELLERRVTRVERAESLGEGRRMLTGKVQNYEVELITDADRRFQRARCSCSTFYKRRLRGGPCRHLMALYWTHEFGAGRSAGASPGWGKLLPFLR